MAQIIYVTPVDDLATGIRAAFDIYSGSGMLAKIITDGTTTVRFDSMDAYKLTFGQFSIDKYIEKYRLD